MPFRSVYSKLPLMPLAGNDVDYLDRHEHLLQSQSSLWSERKQISEGTNMSTLCSQALTAFRSQWPEDECITSSAKQKQSYQRTVWWCSWCPNVSKRCFIFRNLFDVIFSREAPEQICLCLLYKPRTKDDEDRAARQEEKTKPAEKIRGCG